MKKQIIYLGLLFPAINHGCQKEYIYPTNCTPNSIVGSNKAIYFLRTLDGKIKGVQQENDSSKNFLQVEFKKDTLIVLSTFGYNDNKERKYFMEGSILFERTRFQGTHDTFVQSKFFLENKRIKSYIISGTNGKDSIDIIDYSYNPDNSLRQIASRLRSYSINYEYFDEVSNLNYDGTNSLLKSYFNLEVTEKLWKSRTIINMDSKDTSIYAYTYLRDSSNRINKIVTTIKGVNDTSKVIYNCPL